jgi:hypothetical protein
LIDNIVITSTSDVEFAPQPRGITSTPATQAVELASVTPLSVLADKATAAIGSLQKPSESAACGMDPKAKKGIDKQSLQIEEVSLGASSLASSAFTPRTKRTRADTKQLAMGNQLEPRVPKKPGRRANSPSGGRGRGRGKGDKRRESIIETEVNRLERLEALATNIAAADANKAVTAESRKRTDIQQYLTT